MSAPDLANLAVILDSFGQQTLRDVADTLSEAAADMHDSPGTFADGITFAARIVEKAREALEASA